LLFKTDSSDDVLVVSSNGVLRYFLTLIPNEFEQRITSQDFKMAPGRLSKIVLINRKLSVSYWNQDPQVITE